MAATDLFGDEFAPLETTATRTVTLPVSNYRADPRRHHVNKMSKTPRILVDLTGSTADDHLIIAKMQSSDHIHSIKVTGTGGGANLAANLGLWLVGPSGALGTVVDDDLFASAMVIAGADQGEAFTEAALVNGDRAKPLWELLGLTADTFLQYYLVWDVTTALITADESILTEIEYTAG